MPERVLVTGGTGKTGRLVADGLRARNNQITVATRSPIGSDQIRFDWNDPATLSDAIEGIDAIYLVAPTDRIDHLRAMRLLLEMAVARGVGPLVLLSASSLPEGGPLMGEVQGWLHAHAQRWVSLRPTWFMQNFATHHLPAILAEGCLYSATQDGRIAFIDVADIAGVAVEALTDPDFPSGELILTGGETMSYVDVARTIRQVTGRAVRHCRLTTHELAKRYRDLGVGGDYAPMLAAMDGAIAQGSEDRTTDEVERILGRPPTPFEHFVKDEIAPLMESASVGDF